MSLCPRLAKKSTHRRRWRPLQNCIMRICVCVCARERKCGAFVCTYVKMVCTFFFSPFFFSVTYCCLVTVVVLWSSPPLMEMFQYSPHTHTHAHIYSTPPLSFLFLPLFWFILNHIVKSQHFLLLIVLQDKNQRQATVFLLFFLLSFEKIMINLIF